MANKLQTVRDSPDDLKIEKLEFVNQNLNQSQKEAIEFSLNPDRILSCIQGPPGTGKTTTIVELILQFQKLGLKVLAVAPSNIAVDNILMKLAEFQPPGKILRLGHPARIKIKNFTTNAKHQAKNRKKSTQVSLLNYSVETLIENSDQKLLAQDIKKELDEISKKSQKIGKHKNVTRVSWREKKELYAELKTRENKARTEVYDFADVVVGTTTSVTFGHQQNLKRKLQSNSNVDENLGCGDSQPKFDVVIIDEASQCIEIAALQSVICGKKLVLAGDHQQLPPTILSPVAADLKNSGEVLATGNPDNFQGLEYTLLERACHYFGKEVHKLLNVQYRMNRKIMEWSNLKFYENQVNSDESCRDNQLDNFPVIQFINTADCNFYESQDEALSYFNMFEAELVKIHVQKLIQAGLNTEEIGVITPYNAQTVLVKQTLADFESEKDESNSSNPQHDIKNVEVSTVDGFQGREKTAIILTLVRSNPENKIGFLKELRRLNVAVTRAKSHLFVVGDGLTLQKGENGILADFIDFLLKNGVEYFANEFEFDEKYADRFREIRLKDEQIWIDGSNLAKKAAKPQNDAKKSKVQNQKTAKNSEILDPKISYQIEFNLDRLWKFFDQENQQEIRFVEVLPIVRAKIHDVCETIDASQEKFTHQSHDEEGKRILVVRRTKDLEAERRERERLDAINRPVNKKFDKLTIEESRTGSDEEKDQAEDPNLVLCELSGQMVPKENLEIFQIRYRKHQQYMQEQEKQKLMQQEKTRQQQNSMKNSQKSSTKSKPKKSGTAPNTQTKKSASKNTKDGKKKRGDMDNLDDILDFIEDETDEVLKPKGENLVQQIIREGSNKVRGKNFQPESRSRDLKKKQLKNKLGGKLKEMEKDRSKASKK